MKSPLTASRGPLTILSLFLLAFLALGLAACGGGTPAPTVAALAPTTAPTTAPTVAPTIAPTVAPTVVPTTVPTTAPSLAPTVAAVVSGVPSNAVAAAVARIASATSLRMHMALTGDPALMSAFYGIPSNPDTGTMVTDAEFSGDDNHSIVSGFPAKMLTDGDKLETALFGGKSYVHGPVPIMQAPDNKWYQLPPSTSMSTSAPSEMMAKLSAATGDWASFTKSKEGQSLDGQSCDLYTSDKATATKMFGEMMNNTSAPGEPTIDDGTLTATLCPDGYMHDLGFTLSVHLGSQKGEVKYDQHLFDFGKVTLTAPTDFVILSDSNDTTSSTPVPTRTTGTANPTWTPGLDGEWNGTTAARDDISFTVENNAVTYVGLNYDVSSNGCQMSGYVGHPVDNAPIAAQAFTVQWTNDSGTQFIFAGKFTSNGEASGTFHIGGKSKSCASLDGQQTWTAVKGPAQDIISPPPDEPTPTEEAAVTGDDSEALVKEFFDNVNANKLDAALQLLDSDPMMTVSGKAYMSQADIKKYFQGQVSKGIKYTVSGISSVGTIVKFTLQYGTTKGMATVFTDGSTITMLTLP